MSLNLQFAMQEPNSWVNNDVKQPVFRRVQLGLHQVRTFLGFGTKGHARNASTQRFGEGSFPSSPRTDKFRVVFMASNTQTERSDSVDCAGLHVAAVHIAAQMGGEDLRRLAKVTS